MNDKTTPLSTVAVDPLVMPEPELHEPPFCAWCGGTCECEDHYDDDPHEESEFCECDLQYGEEELASNRCACCGGYIEA